MPSPFVANTVNGDVGGFIGSRIKVSVRPGYSWGADMNDATQTFHNITGTARVETALGRHWAMFAELHLLRLSVRPARPVPPSTLATGLTRQGLRWGLAFGRRCVSERTHNAAGS